MQKLIEDREKTIEGVDSFVNDKIGGLTNYLTVLNIQDKLYIERLEDIES